MLHYEVIFLLMSVAAAVVCQDQESAPQEIDVPLPEMPRLPVACTNRNYCSVEDFEAEGIVDEHEATWREWWSDKLNGRTTLQDRKPIEWTPFPDSQVEGSDDCEAHPVEVRTIRYVRNSYDPDEPWVPAAYTPDYQQQVYIQKCKNENATCFKELRVTDGVRACCMQEVTHLVVKVWNGESTATETYQLPAYCSCKICSEPDE